MLPSQSPRLRLLGSHAVTKKDVDEAALWEPGVVAPGQEWIESVNGQDVRRTGTLLLFDISNINFGGTAMLRVRPCCPGPTATRFAFSQARARSTLGTSLPR